MYPAGIMMKPRQIAEIETMYGIGVTLEGVMMAIDPRISDIPINFINAPEKPSTPVCPFSNKIFLS